MPIPELTALGFTAKEDSSYFMEEVKDPTIRKEMEGGFVQTRARFTRPAPFVFSTGWTDIPQAQKAIFQAFFNSKRGGANSFTYIHPVSGDSFTVRFSVMPSYKYAGIGGFHRWDIANVKLEQV